MKLLISGASGYIGSHLLKKIDTNKYELCILVRKQLKDLPINSVVIDTTKTEWKKQVRSFNPEVVLHLASHLTSSDDESQIDKLIDANISFGTHILDALKGTSVKIFINTGTFAEYHMRDGKRTPAYLYAATKTAFCSIVNYYQAVIGYKVFNIIPYTVYGGNHSAKKLIDYIFESLDVFTAVNMTPGEQVLDLIHIDDVVDFYKALLSNLDNCTNSYNEIHIGSGEGITPKAIARLMETITGKKTNLNWGGLPYRPNDTMFSVAPKELSGQQIGWQPSLNIEEGIRLYIKEKQ